MSYRTKTARVTYDPAKWRREGPDNGNRRYRLSVFGDRVGGCMDEKPTFGTILPLLGIGGVVAVVLRRTRAADLGRRRYFELAGRSRRKRGAGDRGCRRRRRLWGHEVAEIPVPAGRTHRFFPTD